MRTEDTIQIEYQMNRRELAEMCIRALVEMLIRQKVIFIIFLIAAVLGLIEVIANLRYGLLNWLSHIVSGYRGVTMSVARQEGGHVLGIMIVFFVFLAVFFLILFAANYRHFVKSGCLDPQRIRLENGYLISGWNGNSRFPCRSYSVIKEGYGIVMIGIRISSRITSYTGIPKRAFSSPEEREEFLRLLADSVPSEEKWKEAPMLDRGGDLVLSFDISEERWAHIYGEASRILSDRLLSGRRNIRGSYLIIGILGCCQLVNAIALPHTLTQRLLQLVFFLLFAGILLVWDGSKNRNQDFRYRNMAAEGKIQNNTIGWWEIGIRPEGGYLYHNENYIGFQWSDYCYRIDMGDTLFFFEKSQKHYFFIPKEVLGGQEDAAGFYDYFYQKGMTFQIPPVKSNWNGSKIAGITTLALAAGLAVMVAAGNMFSSISGSIYQSYEEYNHYSDAGEVEETERFVFHPEDYPGYMPLAVQIEVLKSLGIEAPTEEEMKQYENWMEEDDYYRAYLEGTPYVGILGEMGAGDYDETTDEYTYHPSVYWFDFEGWDISEDYLDILKAFQVMSGGDFELTDLKEDMQNANWEEGTGAILVMFRYNKNAYAFEAEMMYDWIDPAIIGFFNEVLEKEMNPKRIFCMGDGGQGAILFYNTKEWAGAFFDKTGIKLEAPRRAQVEPKIAIGGR